MAQIRPIRGSTGDDEEDSAETGGSSLRSTLGKALVGLAVLGLAYVVSQRTRGNGDTEESYDFSIDESDDESSDLTSAVSRIDDDETVSSGNDVGTANDEPSETEPESTGTTDTDDLDVEEEDLEDEPESDDSETDHATELETDTDDDSTDTDEENAA